MSEPIVFISRHKIKEGKLEEFKELSAQAMQGIERDKPATVGQLGYVDEDGSEVTFIHLFPDAEAMDRHFEGADERAQRAYEFIEPLGWEIYGQPSDQVLRSMEKFAAEGRSLVVKPEFIGGFMRSERG